MIALIVILLSMKTIPNDRVAELSLVGAALQGRYDDILAAGCDESYFNDLKLRQAWLELGKMSNAGESINEETALHRFKTTQHLGLLLFNDCMDHCPAASSWEHWFSKCDEKRKARAILNVGLQLSEDINDGDNLEEIIANAEAQIMALSAGSITTGRDRRAEGVDYAMDMLTRAHKGEDVGVSTGLACMDRLLGGMFPGELVVLAGRPATGKTALALSIADYHASRGNAVAFFSYEMTAGELAMRVVTQRCDIDLRQEIINRRSDESQRLQLMQMTAPHFASFRKDPMIIINEKYTTSQIASKARKLKRDHDIKLIVVDYLQLVRTNREDQRMDRHVQVGKISDGLKSLAMELQVPVLALAQFNRGAANDDRAPSISQIRESGSIEQDADVCWLLWCAEPSMFDGPKQLLQLDVGKNRKGRQGSVNLVFTRNKLRFEDAEDSQHEAWLNEKRKQQVAC